MMRGFFYDLLIIAGIASIGQGLWMYKPWVSLVVVGVIALVLGTVMQIKRAPEDD